MWNRHYPNYLDSIQKNRKVLVAPLNWGLGHASRCIPLIHDLIEREHEVVLASDGVPLDLLTKEFPNLSSIELPSYNIDYTGGFTLSFLRQLPKVLKAIKKEKHLVAKLHQEHQFDLIISDNRYGVRHDKVKSILLIHQLQIKFGIPGIQEIGRAINRRMINRFDECWIPDFPDHRSIAGDLSKTYGIENAKYIGPLSRLSLEKKEAKQDIGIILSGPEPNRSQLEHKLYEQLKNTKYSISIIRGTSESSTEDWSAHTSIDLGNTEDIKQLIETSRMLITRSGYTTMMDLYSYKLPTILIPTPGQSEQEYLASICKEPMVELRENNLDNLDNLIDGMLTTTY